MLGNTCRKQQVSVSFDQKTYSRAHLSELVQNKCGWLTTVILQGGDLAMKAGQLIWGLNNWQECSSCKKESVPALRAAHTDLLLIRMLHQQFIKRLQFWKLCKILQIGHPRVYWNPNVSMCKLSETEIQLLHDFT